jgi:hypothetical protein
VLDVIEHSALARFIGQAPYVYPILSAAHVAGIGLLFGPIVAVDLRLIGVLDSRLDPARDLLVRLSLTGFLMAAVTGALLFTVQATDYAANPAFLTKLVLIGVAGLNAALFRLRPVRARLAAALSLTVWVAAIFAGRMIAFVT